MVNPIIVVVVLIALVGVAYFIYQKRKKSPAKCVEVGDPCMLTADCCNGICPTGGGVCEIPKCVMSDWSDWSACDATCGGGTYTRTQVVIQEPNAEGIPCPPLTDTESCNTQNCPIDCQVGDWTPWGTCSAVCGGGTQSQTRPITVNPQYGGVACPPTSQSQPCGTDVCPVCQNGGVPGNYGDGVVCVCPAGWQGSNYSQEVPTPITVGDAIYVNDCILNDPGANMNDHIGFMSSEVNSIPDCINYMNSQNGDMFVYFAPYDEVKCMDECYDNCGSDENCMDSCSYTCGGDSGDNCYSGNFDPWRYPKNPDETPFQYMQHQMVCGKPGAAGGMSISHYQALTNP